MIFLFSVLLSLLSVHAKCPDDPLDCLSRSEVRNELLLDHDDLLMAASTDVAADATDTRFSLNDTQATTCANNTSDKSCIKCSKCPKNGVQLRSCNSTHDTQCMCEKGSYLSILDYECKACSACPHGFGVWKKCTRYRDTKCRQCPPGSYSGVMSNQMGCVLCSTCESHQIMLQECSRIQNTVCVDKSIGQRIHLPSVTSDDLSSPSKYYEYDSSASLHVYFALLVVIICCVSFYVLLKWRLRRLVKSSPFKGPFYASQTTRCKSNIYSPLPVAAAANMQHFKSQTPGRGERLSPHMDSAFQPLTASPYGAQQAVVITVGDNRCSLQYTDLPSGKKRNLEACLNSVRPDGRDWRLLAKELSFNDTSIKSFARLADQKHGPSRHLLQHWVKRDGRRATVAALLMTLIRMDRMDAALMLQPLSIRSNVHL